MIISATCVACNFKLRDLNTLIVFDMVAFSCFFVAATCASPYSWYLWAIGNASLAPVLFALVSPAFRAKSPIDSKLTLPLAVVLALLSLSWLIGEGIRSADLKVGIALNVCLDVLSKSILGYKVVTLEDLRPKRVECESEKQMESSYGAV